MLGATSEEDGNIAPTATAFQRQDVQWAAIHGAR